MRILTTVLPFVAIAIYFILFLPLLIILTILKKWFPKQVSRVAQPFVKYGFRFVMFFTGTKTVRLGVDKIPRDRAVMFAANHRGFLDAALAYGSLPVQTGIVAKKEVKKVPFLSWWMNILYCYFLDRSNPREGLKMILTSVDNINNGISMFICPEGTRSRHMGMNPFKEASFKMALKTGCPIVPVAMSGSDDLFENSTWGITKSVTVVEYGDPIYIDSLSDEERKHIGAYVQGKVAEMLEGHEKYIAKNHSRVEARKNGTPVFTGVVYPEEEKKAAEIEKADAQSGAQS